MKFKSDSVILNNGINLKIPMYVQKEFPIDYVTSEMVDNAIDQFNVELDKRKSVTETIDGIKVDIIRMGIAEGVFYLWVVIDKENVEKLKESTTFTFSGILLYSDSNAIIPELVSIKNVLYRNKNCESWNSLLSDTKI